jgi:hypothetical protein
MCGAISGFSFDKPYHPRINPDHGDKLDSQCASVRPGGQCWVCNGTGKGIAHLNGMGKKQKQAAKEQLEREGWNLTFLRRGEACWMGERETVVKDFGQHVKPQFLSDSALLSTTEGGR